MKNFTIHKPGGLPVKRRFTITDINDFAGTSPDGVTTGSESIRSVINNTRDVCGASLPDIGLETLRDFINKNNLLYLPMFSPDTVQFLKSKQAAEGDAFDYQWDRACVFFKRGSKIGLNKAKRLAEEWNKLFMGNDCAEVHVNIGRLLDYPDADIKTFVIGKYPNFDFSKYVAVNPRGVFMRTFLV